MIGGRLWLLLAGAASLAGTGVLGSGPTLPGSCNPGDTFIKTAATTGLYFCDSSGAWQAVGSGGAGGLPTGAVVLITSGACPTGFTEATDLNGVMIRGTLAANGDVGTTGGSDSITPAGTNSAPTFAGNALAAHSHTAGTYGADAASGGTPAGTIAWPAGVPTQAAHTHDSHTSAAAGSGGAQKFNGPTTHSSVAPAISWPVGVPTFAGSALANHTHTVSGTSQAVGAGTPAGTVTTPAFTGTAFDNRPAFLRVIFCRKT